ncbi:MAG: GNAT family N-acetyltransferase [Pirellulaceae bacterium]
MITIRNYQDSDAEAVLQLYRDQSRDLPLQHPVGKQQFRNELLTTRFIRDPADHDSSAQIALVATDDDRVEAFVSGGKVVNGDEVVESGTAYVQSVIARPSAGAAVAQLLEQVITHLKEHDPLKIVAHDGCLCPVFFADSAGSLPSRWSRIGQWLVDAGFNINETLVRLALKLDQPRTAVEPPDDLQFIHIKHEMKHFDPEYDFGCLLMKPPYEYGNGVVWCGTFYSGAFVDGTGFDSLYINYFTVMDNEYRGRGLARLVLQHCLHEAQQNGAQFASLLTDASNFVARNLYQSEGFEVVDTLHSFVMEAK